MGKALDTKSRILDRALELSSMFGLSGLTIGKLAEELRLSKSGLYAHFESKEELQLEVLRSAAEEFIELVIAPALARPRGESRLIALFDNWLQWSNSGPLPGGCIFVAVAVEVDDQEGPVRDQAVDFQVRWMGVLARAISIAQEEGEFRPDVDPRQLAFELHGIMLSFHHQARLLREPLASDRARAGYAHFSARARETLEITPYSELLARLAPAETAEPTKKKGKKTR